MIRKATRTNLRDYSSQITSSSSNKVRPVSGVGSLGGDHRSTVGDGWTSKVQGQIDVQLEAETR